MIKQKLNQESNKICDVIPDMITVDELQAVLAIGRDTAYNLVRRKDFPSIKLGREYRVFVEQLPVWLMKQQKNK
jgi:excisionase family DNA binding protein